MAQISTERHPESGLPMVYAGGAWRVLGCLEPYQRSPLASWSERGAVLGTGLLGGLGASPPAFQERDLRASWPEVPVVDQAATQSCVGHAAETVFSYAWLQGGLKRVVFSPTFVYGLINGGRDAGAVISDAMTVLKMYGIAEARYVPEGMIYRAQYPAEAFANARRYRAVEVLACQSFDDICMAISLGFPVISGIYVGQNFVRGDLASDGVAPLPDRVVGGHALSHVGVRWSAARNQRIVLTQNSWSERWGMRDASGVGGFCYLTEGHWGNMRMDAWAVVGVYDDPEDADDAIPVAH